MVHMMNESVCNRNWIFIFSVHIDLHVVTIKLRGRLDFI